MPDATGGFRWLEAEEPKRPADYIHHQRDFELRFYFAEMLQTSCNRVAASGDIDSLVTTFRMRWDATLQELVWGRVDLTYDTVFDSAEEKEALHAAYRAWLANHVILGGSDGGPST